MTKNLRKAIMKKYHLKTKYFKTNTTESLILYKKQENLCNKLQRKKYDSSLKINKETDNKAFWKTIKPFFPIKTQI